MRTVVCMDGFDGARTTRSYPTVDGGVVVLRPVHSNLEGFDTTPGTYSSGDATLRETILECVRIEPYLVDPRDEVEPTWVHQRIEGDELLELSEALARVAGPERAALIADHIAVLTELVAHHRSAEDTHPVRYGGETPWCALCVADPESHAQSLASAIVWRTGELIDAIALWGEAAGLGFATPIGGTAGRTPREA